MMADVLLGASQTCSLVVWILSTRRAVVSSPHSIGTRAKAFSLMVGLPRCVSHIHTGAFGNLTACAWLSLQNSMILSAAIFITIIGLLGYLHFVKIDQETLLIIDSLGIQMTSSYASGKESTTFIEMDKVKDVIINEAIYMVSKCLRGISELSRETVSSWGMLRSKRSFNKAFIVTELNLRSLRSNASSYILAGMLVNHERETYIKISFFMVHAFLGDGVCSKKCIVYQFAGCTEHTYIMVQFTHSDIPLMNRRM